MKPPHPEKMFSRRLGRMVEIPAYRMRGKEGYCSECGAPKVWTVSRCYKIEGWYCPDVNCPEGR